MDQLESNLQAGAVSVLSSDSTHQFARKWPISYWSVESIAVASDAVVILLSGVLSGILYHLATIGAPGDVLKYLGSSAIVTAFFISLMKIREMYKPSELLDFKVQARGVTLIWLAIFLFLASVVFALKIGEEFSRGAILSFVIFGLGCLLVERLALRMLLVVGLASRKFSGRNVVLITSDFAAADQALSDNLTKHGLQLRQQFTLPPREQWSRHRESVISQVMAYLKGSDIHEVIVSSDLNHWSDLGDLLSALRKFPLPVTLVPKGASSEILRRPSHVLGGAVCIELQRGPLSSFERTLKRLVDIVCAGTGLVILAPLMLVAALAIKLDSPGPILFRQRRCGFNGRSFQILKFRTMSVLEDGDSIRQASQSDDRVTRLGRWLRRTSIDELPQLLNVLEGSMSLVGPRPHALAHNDHFDRIVSNYAFRHHVKPGLTGWAQVNGHRGPTPNVADIRRRVEHDLWYINNWSFGLDCLILLRTAFALIQARNAY